MDPRYASVQGRKNGPQVGGVRVLSTTLPDILLCCCGDYCSDTVAHDALRVSVLRFRCKSRQIVPLSGK